MTLKPCRTTFQHKQVVLGFDRHSASQALKAPTDRLTAMAPRRSCRLDFRCGLSDAPARLKMNRSTPCDLFGTQLAWFGPDHGL
jgi:hypothetical protein